MMRPILFSFTAIVIFNLCQAQTKTISLKKGEALDLLLLTTNREATEELQEYFAKAVPIASEWGYVPQYSSKVSTSPTQGNYWPETVIVAKWKDYEKRVKFTEDIINRYPQFHERRRTIWPTFYLTYWRVEEDQEVVIQPDKLYVATSYWSDEPKDFASFQDDWAMAVTRAGGKIVLDFEDGMSPFGYHYDPEVFTITEWDSHEAFERFHVNSLSLDHRAIKHVNQFILQ